jgi:hypothetical protein
MLQRQQFMDRDTLFEAVDEVFTSLSVDMIDDVFRD